MGTMSKTERAHEKFREGQYEAALQLYTEALSVVKLNAHRIALHSNRAACYLKLKSFKKAAEECSAVLQLDPKHAGALMLRAQTLVAIKDYHSALFDAHRLIEIDPSSNVYRNLQARLKSQLSLAPIPEAEDELPVSEMVEMKSPSTLKESPTPPTLQSQETGTSHLKGWEVIPKPKGHSGLDYSRWDKIGNDLSDDEEDDDSQPRSRFRLRTVGLHPVIQG
eukprot:Gb_26385 [translate_table: standard]